MNHKTAFRQGMTDGIPIALGYMAVSFTFGIMAKNAGLTAFQAVLLSLTNLTSAGQFAGLGIITASASYIEMAFTQLVINLRYCLMSCALSQKLDQRTPFFHRFFIAYGNTDEIFGVCSCKEGKLNTFYISRYHLRQHPAGPGLKRPGCCPLRYVHRRYCATVQKQPDYRRSGSHVHGCQPYIYLAAFAESDFFRFSDHSADPAHCRRCSRPLSCPYR